MTLTITKSIPSLRKAIRQEIEELEAKLAMLRVEDEALATAEKIAARYSTQPTKPTAAPVNPPIKQAKPSGWREARNGTPRPKGVPTLPEMITFAIRSATKEGKSGLTGKEIRDHIDKTYWPGVGSNLVLPTAHRLVKAKRLKRSGDLFLLAPEKENGGEQLFDRQN